MQSMLTVRMDQDVKDEFLEVCAELGTSASSVVNMLARQMVRDGALPFVPSLGRKGKGDILTLNAIRSLVTSAASRYPQIGRVTLFGSYARGEATEKSDVDLRIEYDKDSGFSMVDLASFKAELERGWGRSVDVVSRRTLDKELAAEISRDGVTVYERADS